MKIYSVTPWYYLDECSCAMTRGESVFFLDPKKAENYKAKKEMEYKNMDEDDLDESLLSHFELKEHELN